MTTLVNERYLRSKRLCHAAVTALACDAASLNVRVAQATTLLLGVGETEDFPVALRPDFRAIKRLFSTREEVPPLFYVERISELDEVHALSVARKIRELELNMTLHFPNV